MIRWLALRLLLAVAHEGFDRISRMLVWVERKLYRLQWRILDRTMHWVSFKHTLNVIIWCDFKLHRVMFRIQDGELWADHRYHRTMYRFFDPRHFGPNPARDLMDAIADDVSNIKRDAIKVKVH